MPFLAKKDCARYHEAIMVFVYSDRISAYAVEKHALEFAIIAAATEYLEEGPQSSEIIRFNCEKVIQKMPREHLFRQRPIIFFIDPALSNYAFISVDARRERKNTPISDVELNAIIVKYYGTGNESDVIFRNFPIEYLVDGFAVPQPLFLNGQDITAHLVSISVSKELESVFSQIASAHGLLYAGMMNICQLISESPVFIGAEDGVCIALFQNETICLLIRGKQCAGVGRIPAGYGILEQETAKSFAVGTQEARSILRAWQKKQVDENVARAIDGMVSQAIALLTEQLQKALPSLDFEHLLPAAFSILQFSSVTQMAQGIANSPNWLKDAPVARNARIAFIGGLSTTTSGSDSITKDNPESAADVLLIAALLQ